MAHPIQIGPIGARVEGVEVDEVTLVDLAFRLFRRLYGSNGFSNGQHNFILCIAWVIS